MLQICSARPALTSNGGPSLQSGQTPQELLRVFEETQKNMMDLNKKRLAALAEVKTLRARVAKLGMATAQQRRPKFWNQTSCDGFKSRLGKILFLDADAKVAALEQDAHGGKTPFDAPVPALHEEPGAYVPQAKNCPAIVLVLDFSICNISDSVSACNLCGNIGLHSACCRPLQHSRDPQSPLRTRQAGIALSCTTMLMEKVLASSNIAWHSGFPIQGILQYA